ELCRAAGCACLPQAFAQIPAVDAAFHEAARRYRGIRYHGVTQEVPWCLRQHAHAPGGHVEDVLGRIGAIGHAVPRFAVPLDERELQGPAAGTTQALHCQRRAAETAAYDGDVKHQNLTCAQIPNSPVLRESVLLFSFRLSVTLSSL